MVVTRGMVAAVGCVAFLGLASQAEAACKGPPSFFTGSQAEIEAEIQVKAGTGCVFGVSGISGAINEVKITQMPKNGRADVQNLRASYVPKSGYQGPDEFTYVFIGTDQYGGPMRVSIKRKITVVPNL